MKQSIVILLIAFNLALYAQKVTYSDLGNATSNDIKGDYNEYISKNGTSYKVGETIELGQPSNSPNFAFIYNGQGTAYMNAQFANRKVKILKVQVLGTKKRGYRAYLKVNGFNSLTSMKIMLENAIEVKEVKNNVMSSDDALEKLKKAKDKLDLELISKEEYNQIKNDLIKFIK